MRLIFAGTPEFAAQALEALCAAGFDVALVLTQPDRPAGRGMKLQASAVKQVALAHGISVSQPRSLRLDGKFASDAEQARAAIEEAHADAMVVAAYGLILPKWTLNAPRLGCFNIHASLLPRWRGAAPIHRAIEAGDDQTGITIMQMDEGLDTGDMLMVESLKIEPADTTGTLHDKLAALGARMVVQTLRRAEASELRPVVQPADGVCYAAKIDKHEAQVVWTQPAIVIERRVRAFNPFPGAVTTLAGEALKIWSAQALDGVPADANPGQVLVVRADHFEVAAAESRLRVNEVQKAGGKRLTVADFLRGVSLPVGQRLGD